jgi:hypothetical protein
MSDPGAAAAAARAALLTGPAGGARLHEWSVGAPKG